MADRIYSALKDAQKRFKAIAQPQPVSLEYRQWRDRLIRKRFWLGIILAAIYNSIQGLAGFYEVFINPEQLLGDLNLLGLTNLLEAIRQNFIWHKIALIGSFGFLISIWKITWVRKHPEVMLVLIPWAIAFIPEIVLGALFGIPRSPSIIMFMAQVVIVPIHWRLHLLAQIVPIVFYFVIYPLIGLATLGGRSIYSFSDTVQIILVCIVCEVGVYLYEKSKQSELEANRRLQLCIYSITHDLRTPVMGSLMLLESIHESTPVDRPIEISQSEMAQLIHGNNRLLSLMNALLDPQALSGEELVLNRQPTNISAIATTILQDFHRDLIKKNVRLDNRIRSDLPLVDVDARQIGRVFYNLIGNAIAHNPPGIDLTLDAVRVNLKKRGRSQPMLKAIVRDNGIGIELAQQETIFEPYTRGKQTQYLPGLGLGLYICRQVVLAHGGEIGLESGDRKTVFWFTLPCGRA
jgi:signal transduction histidine kinase